MHVTNSSESMLGKIGLFISPIFSPLGFGQWKATVALITGIAAKEAVVSTLGILYNADELKSAFTPLSAYAFMIFTLLYVPCVAAIGAIKREMNSWGWTLFAILYQTGMAYLVTFLLYQIGSLFI